MALTRPRAHQLSGTSAKAAVRVVSESDVTLSGGAPATVDGVSLTVDDRILVTGQTTASQNGLYRCTVVGSGSNGTWVRSRDGSHQGTISAGMTCMVTEGSSYADTFWKLTTDGSITIGTTALTFEQHSGGGGTPGGSNTQVQFNDSSSFGGDAGLTYNKTTDALTIVGTVTGGTLTDGTATITSGAIASVTTIGASGAITGGSLTDGTATLSSGALSGATTLTASGAVTGGSLTDGTATLSSGALSGATTATFTGNVSLGDSNYLRMGAGPDLTVYHDGSNSYIDDVGTGSLFVRSGTTYFQNAAGAKTSISTNAGAGQSIYHNNSLKLVTTATGITVTGTVAATSYTGTLSTVAQPNVTSVGTLSALTVAGDISNGQSDGVGNIGSSTVGFNTIHAKATSAQYADLAEKYTTDHDYEAGTVVVFGGNSEITQSTISHDRKVAGVISTNPAVKMNDGLDGQYLALQGRVPCKVIGPIEKGDLVVTSHVPGLGVKLDDTQYQPGCVIGKALELIEDQQEQVIEVVVGRL
jgi:hypothetical protein